MISKNDFFEEKETVHTHLSLLIEKARNDFTSREETPKRCSLSILKQMTFSKCLTLAETYLIDINL